MYLLGFSHFRVNVIQGTLEHLSGQLRPSEAGIKLTNELVKFGAMIDMQILGHLIITDDNYFSFADKPMRKHQDLGILE